jgi:hypothetical protein
LTRSCPCPGSAAGPLEPGGGAGRRGLDVVPRAPSHHVAVPPSDECPRLRLGGWCGKASPLVPPGRRGVIVGNLHYRRLGAAGEGGVLRRHNDLHCRLRYRSCRLQLRRGDLRLRKHLSGRGHLTRLHG